MSDLPPLLGTSDQPYACERMIGRSPCGAKAAYHIFWNKELDNGCACEKHAMEAIRRWKPLYIHKHVPACSMPSPPSRFYPNENTCKIDEDYGPPDDFDYAGLEKDLEELEREEPAVREAAEEYERVKRELITR